MAGKTTVASHTRDSLSAVAEELENHAAALRASAALLIVEPKISSVEVRAERARNDAMKALRTWVSEAQSAAFDARLKASKKTDEKPRIRISPDKPKPSKS